MLIFRGVLNATTDCNVAINASLNGWKVLYLGDPEDERGLINSYGFITALQLIPDYNILSKEIDGCIDEFDLEYIEMLGGAESCNFFVAILTALYQGINIMMYFPKSVTDFRYPSILIKYFEQQFGIIVGMIDRNCMYIEAYNNPNLLLMYTFNAINHMDFLLYYNGQLDNNIIDRLLSQTGLLSVDNIHCDYSQKLAKILSYKESLCQIASTGRQPVDVCKHEYREVMANDSIWTV